MKNLLIIWKKNADRVICDSCDTGPLVALIDADDPYHSLCTSAVKKIPDSPLLTTWPCATEAMYLLRRASGYFGQNELRAYVAEGSLILHHPNQEEREKIQVLMHQYQDVPMDFADASLVAAAEVLNESRIFTLDKHFHAYRIHEKKPFEVIP